MAAHDHPAARGGQRSRRFQERREIPGAVAKAVDHDMVEAVLGLDGNGIERAQMAVAPVWTQAEKNVRLLEPRHMAVADARQGKAEAAQPRTQQRVSRAAPGLTPCRQKRDRKTTRLNHSHYYE